MQVVSIVFSPTGGTQRIASFLSEALRQRFGGSETRLVDLTEPAPELSPELHSEDVAVIAVPSFGGRAPAVAIDRLSRLNGHGAKTILVCIYGSRAYDDTLAEMLDTATAANFEAIAAVTAVSRHSMLPALASQRPNAGDWTELERFADSIAEKSKCGGPFMPLELPGNRPYKAWNGAMVPKPTALCIRCGTCAENCPTCAIDADDPTVVNAAACAFCMRCIHFCKAGARQLDPNMGEMLTERLRPMCDPNRANELFL